MQHDLGDPRPPARSGGAEVGQPAVVGPQPRPAQLQIALGGAGHLHLERRLGVEGRDRVGEHDLGDDAVGLEVGQPPGVVPVATALVAHEVLEGDGVVAGPVVERLVVALLEVPAVLEQLGAPMTVGRDDHVVLRHSVALLHG